MENNNQDIKLCPVCGEKNKAIYKYCNGCGAPLNQSQSGNAVDLAPNNPPFKASDTGYYGRQNTEDGYTPKYIPYGMNTKPIYEGTPDFNGVSAKDVYEFTGKKTELFNKLCTQHFSGKAGPYCWPLFVLGLIFGFFGMGCWYLYHKMYKPALGFFAGAVVQLVMNICSLIITCEYIIGNFTPEMYNSLINGFLNGDTTSLTFDFLNITHPLAYLLDSTANLLSLVGFTLAIILPFFAYRQYKNFAIESIYTEYSKSALPDLSVKGGSKGGLVALASILYVVIPIIIIFSIIGNFVTEFDKKGMEFSNDGTSNGTYNELPFEFDDSSGELW